MSAAQTIRPGPASVSPVSPHLGHVLINLIVTLLTPMFLSATGGNLESARLAAIETLDSYRAETHADLITVAKLIAFGIATLGSLSLSMADDLPIPTILRLRSSANASDRAEHRNRLVLNQNRPEQPVVLAPEPEIDEAALTAAAAEMQQRTAENLARFTPPAAKSAPVAPAPDASARTEAEQCYHATWAASAAQVAAETAASLPSLPPPERQSAAIWIDVLNEAAKEFMAANIPRPRPGNPAAILPSA